MSQENHKRFLAQSAYREAQKAIRSRGDNFTREDLHRMRIQTIEPWKRILALLIGAFFGFLSAIAIRDDYHMIAIILFPVFCLIFIGTGVFGYKMPVDAVIDVSADITFSKIIDALF